MVIANLVHLPPKAEFLNETLFRALPQARAALESWRCDYNNQRPHSGLKWLTPAAYAAANNPQWALSLRHMDSSAPKPIANLAHPGMMNRRTLVKIG